MNRQRLCAMGAALVLLTGACATIQDKPATDSITLEKPVHFSAPDGTDIVAASGAYTIEATEDRALRLIPSESVSGTTPLIVAAMALPHEQPIESRVALSVPNGEDEHHVVLLLPDGKGLDAGGTYSGLRSRGGSIAPLSIVQLQAALLQQGDVIKRRPSDFDLAYAYAPIHYQDTNSDNYRADYVTRFDYDGNMIATDNWEHLTNFPLAAHVYYSVVETCTHWFVTYGFFHPRDWTNGNAEEHENDMEGLLTIVRKDGTPYGRLEGMITVFHLEFFSYIPPGSPLRNGHENIDGTLTMQAYDGSFHPLSNQEDKGHGVKAFPHAGNFLSGNGGDGIIYFPSRIRAEVPASGNDRHVDYRLIDFFAFTPDGLWQRQLNEAPLPLEIRPRRLPSGAHSRETVEAAVAPAFCAPAPRIHRIRLGAGTITTTGRPMWEKWLLIRRISRPTTSAAWETSATSMSAIATSPISKLAGTVMGMFPEDGRKK